MPQDFEEPELFDSTPFYVAPPESSDLSAGQRLTLRQRNDVADGRHPLTRGPLHPSARPELASPDAPKGAPFTCGSCQFRQQADGYPKCFRYGSPAITHGPATDVRAWWPACTGWGGL